MRYLALPPIPNLLDHPARQSAVELLENDFIVKKPIP